MGRGERRLLLAMGLVLVIFILPALAISWIVPAEELSLTAGIMQAFDAVLAFFGIQWLTPIIGLVIVVALFVQKVGSTRAEQDDASSWQDAADVRPIPSELRNVREGHVQQRRRQVHIDGLPVRVPCARLQPQPLTHHPLVEVVTEVHRRCTIADAMSWRQMRGVRPVDTGAPRRRRAAGAAGCSRWRRACR